MSMAEDKKKYIPREGVTSEAPQKQDMEYAQALKDLHEVINKCQHSDNVALLLSTCRNAFLTLNSLFAELSFAIGSGDTPSPLWKGTDYLSKSRFSNASGEFQKVQRILSQFDKKEYVWKCRKELYAEFILSANSLDMLKRDRILKYISNSKSYDSRTERVWDRKLYDVNLRERSNIADKFADVRRAYSFILRAVRAGRLLCVFASGHGPQQQMMFEDEFEKKKIEWSDVVEALLQAVEIVRFIIEKNEHNGKVTVSSDGIYEELFSFPTEGISSIEELNTIATGVATIITEAANQAYSVLCKAFEPNVAASPMPKPFLIDLTPYQVKGTETACEFRIKVVTPGSPFNPKEEVDIAMAHFPIPKRFYNGHFQFSEDASADEIGESVLKLVSLASSKGAQAILFPEYSLPHCKIDKITSKAREANIILVGGLEGRWLEGNLVNEAIIALPCTGEVYYQKKQKPSVYEEEPYAFFFDGGLKLFKDTDLGSFAVVICSDYLEMDILNTIVSPPHHPDFVLVPAYNPIPDLFRHAAIADSVRMYTNVVIANTFNDGDECSAKGTYAVAPERKMEVNEGEFHSLPGDDNSYGIAIARLSIAAIRCRHRPKPASGYFSPPYAIKPKKQ